MKLQDLKVNDTAVLHEDRSPVVSLNIDISFLCDGDLSNYETSNGLDTTTLKDAVLKLVKDRLHQDITVK